MPWDATTPTHRQFNPLFIASRAAAFASEAAATLRRRAAGRGDPAWLSSPFLPSYYAGGFHYQTDGWLSRASAKVYESSTETLFVGRQDAAQRCTLVALAAFMAGRDASQTRALELGCGTGRFATFVKDNFPRLDLTASDLSPFYLEEARANARYWAAQRGGGAPLGGADGAGVSFLQTPAEAIAAPDASFDLVYSVYLFHELPPEVRRRAAAEAAPVHRPGGLLVITDSTQLGDRPAFDATLGNFTNFQVSSAASLVGQSKQETS
jgi:ubiquinone/menaquinone biosynthesis C-methylase UbiE